MVVEFDPEKSARNVEERGLAFDLVNEFDWSTALILEGDRQDYGELRLVVFGLIGTRLHAAVVTPRADDFRVISLRKANKKEVRLYEHERRSGRTP